MALEVAGMTAAIETAFEKEWKAAKNNTPLPDMGKAERQMLFAAIARGVLEYLKVHQNELVNTITFEDSPGQRVTHTVKEVDLNISTGA